ncbi:disulfide bond formation protein B [Caulobacter sp. NIBR2454]|uniref:disulfide bond formation protein B n=1 Tax=Caulobacter sp. NIBR2454 TaxID=3015996 RepID=UPI0022B74953|nr:disulfide bond formation protein B [Caulobacter sp. NIBR2454]
MLKRMIRSCLGNWPLVAFLASAAMLATAHAFERFGGYAPCYLCLKQREVFWVAMAVSLAAMILVRVRSGPRIGAAFNLLLAAIFLFGAGLAAYHAGAEWKWWPGPNVCGGGTGSLQASDLTALMDGTAKIRPPACDTAAWVFLGLSMAGWNVLISLKLAGWSLVAALKGRK